MRRKLLGPPAGPRSPDTAGGKRRETQAGLGEAKRFGKTQAGAGVVGNEPSPPAASAPPAPAAPPVPGVELVKGTVIAGRFRLEESLGEGGMGVVWRAVHAVTRKRVALKFLKRAGKDDRRAVQRFLREARAASVVRHPSIVEVHDVLELDDGSPVMVMELLEGETLADRLDALGDLRLPVPEFARIMVHVCSAVASAHALGIVHRDLKPDNIFLAESHGSRTVKVLDFGVAKLTALDGDAGQAGESTATGVILGTAQYMAPEQLFGEKDTDHRADIWALGVIFFQILTGALPIEDGSARQVIRFILAGGMPSLHTQAPWVPAPIADIVDRMLSRDRELRPASLGEVLDVLAKYTDEPFLPAESPLPPMSLRSVTPPPVPPPPAPPRKPARTRTRTGKQG